jgi:arabinofuranan 3-O-arabinosyltransferase
VNSPAGSAGRNHASRRLPPWRDLLTIAIPALVVYVPLLLTQPGMVGADTKTYLYLDPTKLLKGAPYVWDYQIGLGTVTHQNIGYLFPMGPFYLLFDKLGVADWVAQRLWIASVMFAAGMGVRYLVRTLGRTRDTSGPGGKPATAGLGTAGTLVAILAYMLSPYLLDYSARISVILLPWAALPWLIALAAKSLRHGGWRYPAWFAFVVLLVGGINATALIMVGLGPLLWVVHAVFVDKEVKPRVALGAVARIGVLTLVTSLWWIGGLWAEGRFGLPVIRYTESYRTVAEASNAPEVLRGLGYWFFYGDDKLGPWIEPSVTYTTHTPILALSYALPVLAFLSAALLRWRYRAYFISIMVFGALLAIGAHPWDTPSFLGGLFKAFTRSDAGLSLRSTPRAVPLVILGSAIFLGAAVDALGRRLPRLAVPIGAIVCLLILLNIPPMWNGTMVAANLERPEQIPSYWLDDAAYLQSRGVDTRVLELPGSDFASYRWGNTVDPVLPGLMDRPYVARELFTWGSPPSANLINALDRRFHEENMDPEALAPIAQLMAVGDINVRSDLQYERYRIARPRTLWALIRRAPGVGDPVRFGPNDPPNIAGPTQTMLDEVEQGTSPNLEEPPRVAAFPIDDPLPILRTEAAAQPLLVAGDGEGLVDAASVGLINPRQAIFYSASLVKDQLAFDRVYGNGADLMLTDSNRKRSRRWGALRENTGYTERAGETPLAFDPTDQRLDVFPGAGDDAYTVTEQRGQPGATVDAVATATGYGNPITYTPDDRPANALDGDPLTAWRVGAISTVTGEQLYLDLASPVTTDHVNLLQPINLERTRWITRAKLSFDGGGQPSSSIEIDLDERSRDESGAGQDVSFPSRPFQKLTIEVLDTNLGKQSSFDGVSGVGFAEVRLPGVNNEELVRVPSDLMARAGESSRDHRAILLFTRMRSNPAEPVRTDEEVAIRRVFTLPSERTFSVGGQARVSAYLHDHEIDALLGLRDATRGGVTAKADVHLPGNLEQRSSAAIDGDPATFWTSIYQKQTGHWIEYTSAAPLTFDHLEMDIVADGRHSVPTRLHLDVDGVDHGDIEIPAIEDQPTINGTVHVSVPLPAGVTGSTLRFTIAGVREVRTQEWYSSGQTITPVAIAEIGVPGLHLDPARGSFDSGCRPDLLSVDDHPVPMRVTGAVTDAITKLALHAEACRPEDVPTTKATGTSATVIDGTRGIPMGTGEHVVRTGIGRNSSVSIDLDRLAFASDRGGAMLPLDRLPTTVADPPVATTDEIGRVDARLTITGATAPFWLVQGQSWNPGWTATVNGHALGAPVPINGYANGWYVDPAVVGSGTLTAQIDWTPQKVVWIFIALSIVGLVACLGLMLFGGRRRGRREDTVLAADAGRPLAPALLLDWPWRGDELAPVSRRTALIVAAGYGVFAAVNLPNEWQFPLLALPLAGALYLALVRIRRRALLGLAAAASFGLAASYYLIQQRRHRFAPNFVWPALFERVHILGVVAVLLFAAEGLRDLVGRPDPDPRDSPEGPPDLPSSDPAGTADRSD